MPKCPLCGVEVDHLVECKEVTTGQDVCLSDMGARLIYDSDMSEKVCDLSYECPACEEVLFTTQGMDTEYAINRAKLDAVRFLEGGMDGDYDYDDD